MLFHKSQHLLDERVLFDGSEKPIKIVPAKLFETDPFTKVRENPRLVLRVVGAGYINEGPFRTSYLV